MYQRKISQVTPKKAKKPKKGEAGYVKTYGDWDWEDHLTESSRARTKLERPSIEGLGGTI